MIIAGIFVGIIAGIYQQDVNLARLEAEKFYAQASETYVTEEVEPQPTTPDWYGQVEVNLAELQEVNPDVIGWIFFENDPINYPILYSGDNNAYLRHTYTGEYAIAGSIFIDGDNHPDFTDSRTIIYGHNMDDDTTMFSRLLRFLDKSYYDEHRFFQIITNNAAYRYEIYASEVVEPTDARYELHEADLKNSGNYYIMLSTCYNGNKNRVLTSAVRVDEYNF